MLLKMPCLIRSVMKAELAWILCSAQSTANNCQSAPEKQIGNSSNELKVPALTRAERPKENIEADTVLGTVLHQI